MSEHIRTIRHNDGHVTSHVQYEAVAEQFDSVIKKMQLGWRGGITLRSGNTYQPPRHVGPVSHQNFR